MTPNLTLRLISLLILVLSVNSAFAENPYTLIDREQLPRSVSPSLFDCQTDQLFFLADDPQAGRELWVHRVSGVGIVRDIYPGPKSAFATQVIGERPQGVGIGNTLYFVADDGLHGEELWRSDGTEAGTVMLQDITPGPTSTRIRSLHRFNSQVFFIVETALGRLEFWRTDNSVSGVSLLRSTNSVPRANAKIFATMMGGELFFAFEVAGGGIEIWKTNLSVAGTVQVPNNSYIQRIHALTNFNDLLVIDGGYFNSADRYLFGRYPPGFGISSFTNFLTVPFGPGLARGDSVGFFAGRTSVSGGEIWRTNGSYFQTAMIADLTPGAAGTTITKIIPWGERAIVRGSQGPQGEIGPFVWVTNSSGVGASQLVVPFATSIGEISPLSSSHFLMVVTTEGEGEELWISDGTLTGTSPLVSIAEGTASAYPAEFSSVEGAVYFTAYNRDGVQQLWRVNSATRSASKVADLSLPAPIWRYVGNYYADGSKKINDSLIIPPHYTGHDLFTSRGTPGTTEPVPGVIFEKFLSQVNDRLMFVGNPRFSFNGQSQEFEGEIWGTSGPAETFERFGELDYGTFVDLPRPISTSLGSRLLYRAHGQVPEQKALWSLSAGVAPGGLISPVNPQNDFENVKIGNVILFAGYTQGQGTELWKTDGTLAGTSLVADLSSGPFSSNPRSFVVMNNNAYFYTDSVGLMRTDGTAIGTIPLFYLGSLSEVMWGAIIPGLYVYNGHVYFFYNNPSTFSLTLWKTDGTMAGTSMVSSSLTNVPGYGEFLGIVGGRLLFFGSMGGAFGLWSTDGTAAGTLALAAGSLNSDMKFEHLITSPSEMYFVCTANHEGEDGYELCRTDGTILGTSFVANIEDNGSSVSSFPRDLTLVNGEVFFTAYNSAFGRELWRTKGLSLNTSLALDLNSGPQGSDPGELVAMGTNLIFRADDGEHGRELWGFSTIGDECPDDSQKTSPGLCGCGNQDIDSDGDSVLDCNDACPLDLKKSGSAGLCGCGISDDDTNQNDLADCFDPSISSVPGKPTVKVKGRTITASAAAIEGVRYEFVLSGKKKSQGKPKKRLSANGKAVFKRVPLGGWRVKYRLLLGTVNVQSSPFSSSVNVSVRSAR